MRPHLLALVLTTGCTTLGVEASEGNESEVVALLGECPAGQWCIESTATAAADGPLLHAVWAANANDVFAAGDGGTILRRVNGSWIALDSGTTNDLRGLWGTSPSDVWASGVAGTILHFDGTRWTTIAGGGTSDIDAVWASGVNDVWFTGSSRALRYNGQGFQSFSLVGTMVSISGTGPNDVWVAGEGSYPRRFNGAFFSPVNPGAGTTMFAAVLAIGINDVWATSVASGKEAIHFTGGSKWPGKPTGGVIFTGLSALAGNDVWAVGQRNIGHWDGVDWLVEAPLGSVQLWSVSATPGNAWVVGDDALIAHRTF